VTKDKRLIGQWSVGRPLNKGGQAEVFEARAHQVKHSPPAALKLYFPPNDQARARIEREHTLLRRIVHPGVIAVRDSGEHEGRPFIVLELASFSLSEIHAADAKGERRILRRSPTLLLELFRQACEGVLELHQQGIVHRDLKPDNILLIDESKELFRAVVADLGIASEEEDQGNITQTHEAVGTPKWRAPELGRGEKATRASDVYGLGRVLEFLLTGRSPDDVQPRRIPDDLRISDELRRRLDEVIACATEHDPRKRTSSVQDLLESMPAVYVASVDQPQGGTRNTLQGLDDTALAVIGWMVRETGVQAELPAHWVWDELTPRIDKLSMRVALKRLEDRRLVHRSVDDVREYPVLVVAGAAVDLVDTDMTRVQNAMKVVLGVDDPLDGLDL
jgi:serine/threonine protein kinase